MSPDDSIAIPWKQYQERCATFFRGLGLSAQVDKTVEGTRGVHAIDVFVNGHLHGIDLKWIVECKAWKTNIPKEKALALLAIVQDIGADKGILLSEVGFQSGALRAIRGTNVLLTSLEDLKAQVEETFIESTISQLHWRLTRINNRLWELHGEPGRHSSPHMTQLMKIMFLDVAFEHALKGQFPTNYAMAPNDGRLKAYSFDELVARSDELLSEAEEHAAKFEADKN